MTAPRAPTHPPFTGPPSRHGCFVKLTRAQDGADRADELSVRKKAGPGAPPRRGEREDVLQGDVANERGARVHDVERPGRGLLLREGRGEKRDVLAYETRDRVRDVPRVAGRDAAEVGRCEIALERDLARLVEGPHGKA